MSYACFVQQKRYVLHFTFISDENIEEPVELEQILSDPKQLNPKLGIGWCKFNSEGNLLASQNGN